MERIEYVIYVRVGSWETSIMIYSINVLHLNMHLIPQKCRCSHLDESFIVLDIQTCKKDFLLDRIEFNHML
jgi:hypothetical protein